MGFCKFFIWKVRKCFQKYFKIIFKLKCIIRTKSWQPIPFRSIQNTARWLRSDLVHKPLSLGYISIWTPWSNGNWCDDCGWHWYINLRSSSEYYWKCRTTALTHSLDPPIDRVPLFCDLTTFLDSRAEICPFWKI